MQKHATAVCGMKGCTGCGAHDVTAERWQRDRGVWHLLQAQLPRPLDPRRTDGIGPLGDPCAQPQEHVQEVFAATLDGGRPRTNLYAVTAASSLGNAPCLPRPPVADTSAAAPAGAKPEPAVPQQSTQPGKPAPRPPTPRAKADASPGSGAPAASASSGPAKKGKAPKRRAADAFADSEAPSAASQSSKKDKAPAESKPRPKRAPKPKPQPQPEPEPQVFGMCALLSASQGRSGTGGRAV